MQSGSTLCVVFLAFCADAVDFSKAKEQLNQEPVPVTDLVAVQSQTAPAQQPVVPPMQVVTDATDALQSSEQALQNTLKVAATQVVTNANQPAAVAPPISANARIFQPQATVAQPVEPSQLLLTASWQQPQALVALPGGQTASQPSVSAVALPALKRSTRNVTKLALGQITDLGSEFHQLREDDQAHIKQLGVDIHLREHLEQQLHQAEERLEHDNSELVQSTSGISALGTNAQQTTSPQNSTSDASTAALVQAQSIKSKAEQDEVALATARDVKTLADDMNALRARDVSEVKALRGNAETRSELSAQIAKEREELLSASEGLAANLGQIRDLVTSSPQVIGAPAQSSAGTVDGSPDAAASSETQEMQVVPAQETVPSAAGDAATPAPEAAAETSSSWLR